MHSTILDYPLLYVTIPLLSPTIPLLYPTMVYYTRLYTTVPIYTQLTLLLGLINVYIVHNSAQLELILD